MAKRSHSFDLDLDAEAAPEVIRAAVSSAGWQFREKGDYLEAREDATKLCCNHSPVTAKIRVSGREKETRVQVDAEVPGWGPIANRQLPDRLRMLERVIRERSSSRSPSPV